MFSPFSKSFFTALAIALLLSSSAVIGSFMTAISAYSFPGLFPSQSTSPYTKQIAEYDKEKNCAMDQHTPTTYMTYLTHFSCGHVTVFNNGTTLRRFTLVIDDYHGIGKNIPITKEGLQFPAWTFNGSVPGPTLRMT